jgi:hypothetical protein
VKTLLPPSVHHSLHIAISRDCFTRLRGNQ